MGPAAKLIRPVLIAGGGIGGLAAALALAGQGQRCRILERRPDFGEAGAGIQIGPNGVHALRSLGIAAVLEPKAGRPEEIVVYDGVRGRALTALPLGAAIEARLGAPYWTAHRSDLHAALLDRAQRHDLIAITPGFSADRLEATADGVRILAVSGAAASGSALIGADGLWSKVRSYVADRTALRFAGRRAYRAVVAAAAAPAGFQANAIGLWLTPGAHIVHYPVRAGTEIALVVILAGETGGEGWSQAADRKALMAAVARLAPAIVSLIGAAQDWQSWPLYEAPALERWCNGRIALLGDAAHPVLPFLAQGGVLALEDALTLAGQMARSPGDVETAFTAYGKARMKRARRVALASHRNGAIYHLSGAAAVARNAVLRATPGPRLISHYDWLYSWTPGGL